ncbi:MAG: dockerin type I repeat-containing protein [Eubacterium sp.]|nr:dockerin type I repeat-containing protein [Eubacterium sp.]
MKSIKKVKKMLALFLAVMMVFGTLTISANAAAGTVTVDPTITGGVVTVETATGENDVVTATVTVTPDEGNVLIPGSLKYSYMEGETEQSTAIEGAESAVKINESNGTYTFTVPEVNVTVTAAFEKAGDPEATVWDGKTVDVSWYNTTDTEFHIDKPAELAGLAAIANGVITSDITTIIGDEDGTIIKATWFEDPSGYGGQQDGWRGTDEFLNKVIYIDADLDMGGVYDAATDTWSGARFMPIAGIYRLDPENPDTQINACFTGSIDGQGHTIKNIYAELSNSDWAADVALVGLWGLGDGEDREYDRMPKVAFIRNVIIGEGYIDADRSVGSIVGKVGKSGTSGYNGDMLIENCANYATIIGHQKKGTGGIVGAAWNSIVIKNCYNAGSVTCGQEEVGGITGSAEGPIINCFNMGMVNGGKSSNGIAYDNWGASFTNCYYLEGTATGGGVNSSEIKSVTAEYIKSAEFLAALNGNGRAFVVGDDGYPVLRVSTEDTSTFVGVTKNGEPKRSYIEGQKFDTTGLEIWASYSDDTKELITDYNVSIDGPLSTSDTKVIVYGECAGESFSYDFEITVEQNAVNEIKITKMPTNMLYASDETFDPTGLVVKAYYTNFPKKGVTLELGKEYSYTFIKGTLVIAYTYNGKTVLASATTDPTWLDTPAPKTNEDGAYLIACENDLIWFANQVNALKKNDINAVVTADLTMPESFTGITNTAYAGTFDGGNHTITLNMSGTGYQALFKQVGAVTIKNLVVDGTVTSTSGAWSGVAGIVAYTAGNATIENCVNKADITGCGYTAGIVGNSGYYTLTVKNCTNEGDIICSGGNVGGIVANMQCGWSNSVSSISDCKNTGAIEGKDMVGGIVGYMRGNGETAYCKVENSSNEGNVSGTAHVGGIAGYSSSKYNDIAGCYNVGSVSATGLANASGVGGIVGYNYGEVVNCYNDGSVMGAGTAYINAGGIVGIAYGNSSISNSYNAGTVSSDPEATATTIRLGSLVAYVYLGKVTCENSYYLNVEGLDACGGNFNSNSVLSGDYAAKTSVELKALAPTLGEAYKQNTSSVYHGGYPVLTWEDVPLVYGDANGDGTVNSTDAMLILQYSSSVIDDTQLILSVSDVNGDDAVNSTDAMLVLQYASEVITEFPINAA